MVSLAVMESYKHTPQCMQCNHSTTGSSFLITIYITIHGVFNIKTDPNKETTTKLNEVMMGQHEILNNKTIQIVQKRTVHMVPHIVRLQIGINILKCTREQCYQ